MRKSRVPRVLISVIILFAFVRAHLTFWGASRDSLNLFRHKKETTRRNLLTRSCNLCFSFRCWLRIITSSRKKKKEWNTFFLKLGNILYLRRENERFEGDFPHFPRSFALSCVFPLWILLLFFFSRGRRFFYFMSTSFQHLRVSFRAHIKKQQICEMFDDNENPRDPETFRSRECGGVLW